MPLLANTPFIVTGSGKFFRNVQLDPEANLGVVKTTTARVTILWGLTDDAVPTSELPAHFLSHCERIKATNGKEPRNHALPRHQPDRPDLRAGK